MRRRNNCVAALDLLRMSCPMSTAVARWHSLAWRQRNASRGADGSPLRARARSSCSSLASRAGAHTAQLHLSDCTACTRHSSQLDNILKTGLLAPCWHGKGVRNSYVTCQLCWDLDHIYVSAIWSVRVSERGNVVEAYTTRNHDNKRGAGRRAYTAV